MTELRLLNEATAGGTAATGETPFLITWIGIFLPIVLVFVGCIFLQRRITRNGSVYGLILPIVFLAAATIGSLVFGAYLSDRYDGLTVFFLGFMVWVLLNIPSVILLVIWLARRKRRRVEDIDRLDIHDLD